MSTYDELVEKAAKAMLVKVDWEQCSLWTRAGWLESARLALDAAGLPALLAERDDYKLQLSTDPDYLRQIGELAAERDLYRGTLENIAAWTCTGAWGEECPPDNQCPPCQAHAALSAHQEAPNG